MRVLECYAANISSLCAKHKVKKLYAFGSVLDDRFNDHSDVDFVVEFLPLDVSDYADNYYSLKFALQDTLHRQIDLLEDKAIKNPFFKKALHEQRQLIYG